MDWTDVEARLKEQAEEVCRHLLPQGKREGAEYVCGSIEGQAGRSLKVNVGGKAGVWADFAGDGDKRGKTLISLWCSVRAKPFRECIVEAKGFLGIRDDFDKRVKNYSGVAAAGDGRAPGKVEDSAWKAVAEVWGKCQPLTEGGPVWNYLVGERRLEPSVVEWYGVREMVSFGQWVMVFPYYAPAAEEEEQVSVVLDTGAGGRVGGPTWLKFERLDRQGGKKVEWTSKGPEKCLWGVQVSQRPEFKECRHVLICEGEKDALSWASYGCHLWSIVPVSVPFGAKWKGQVKGQPSPNREWLDRCWDWLQGFETVFVAMDSDEAGRRAAADIISEVGPRRCRLVELPNRTDGTNGTDNGGERFKDINDCLRAGVASEVIRGCVDGARDFAPEKVRRAAEYAEEFMASWFEQLLEPGLDLPFGFPWKVRPAETTIWTGIEKSGKTTLLSFVLMGLLAQGERAMVASFEVRPVKTLKKYSRQAFGGLIYDKRFVDRCRSDQDRAGYRTTAEGDARDVLGWLNRGLWLYDHVGIAHWQDVLDDMRWARRRHGITQFVLDNFMRLGIAKDDYAQQADAITAIVALSMELDVHVHVVVHQNKQEGHRGGASGKRSVSGAFEIIANAHNIVEVQRDEKKGQMMKELFQKREIDAVSEGDFSTQKAQLDLVPDGKFILHAQRDGEEQNGSKYLWFLWESQQYADKPSGHRDHAPIRFVRQALEREKKQGKLELPTNEELGIGTEEDLATKPPSGGGRHRDGGGGKRGSGTGA